MNDRNLLPSPDQRSRYNCPMCGLNVPPTHTCPKEVELLKARVAELETEKAVWQRQNALLEELKDNLYKDITCLLDEKDALKDALCWCSGSGDFAPSGIAHEGWVKLCQPLLTPKP